MTLVPLLAAALLASTGQEVQCLARNVYHEARGEPELGQVAVAQVTMNRVEQGYGRSVCAVVHKPHQFSWTMVKQREPHGEAWARAEAIAWQVYLGMRESVVGRATDFRVATLRPPKRRRLVARIGRHAFYAKR